MLITRLLERVKLDPYIVAIVSMAALASVLPVEGRSAHLAGDITNGAIALLFFLYGGRLSRESVVTGMTHWRLQLAVFLSTFAVFPIMAVTVGWLVRPYLPQDLTLGIVFLGMLPSTVQSSIAFTSIARGNVPAAVCSASFSNIIGIIVTPVLVGIAFSVHGQGFSGQAVIDITVQLFLPFAAGQVMRRWIGDWLARNRRILGFVDRGVILLVVYTAFSEGVVNGLWHTLALSDLVLVLVIDAAMLAAILTITTLSARWLGFERADEIAIVFCGSKKSLASGVPMATILFPGAAVGVLVMPLMLFHQIQLMACAVIARRYAGRG